MTKFEVLEFTNGDMSREPDFTYSADSLAEAGDRIEQEMAYNRNYPYREKTIFKVVQIETVETRTDVPFRFGGVVFD